LTTLVISVLVEFDQNAIWDNGELYFINQSALQLVPLMMAVRQIVSGNNPFFNNLKPLLTYFQPDSQKLQPTDFGA
jgi:hypothetical protein